MSQTAENVVATINKKQVPVKFSATKAAINKMAKKWAKVPDMSTKEGYAQAQQAKRELTPMRTSITKEMNEQKYYAQEHIKDINAKGNELMAMVQKIEKPIYDGKKAQDELVAKKKRDKEEKEERRIAEIESKVDDIQNLTEGLLNSKLETLEGRLTRAKSLVISAEEFMEFVEPASRVLGQVIDQLTNAVTTAKAQVVQQKELDAQQAEIKETQRKADLQESIGRIRMAPVDLVGSSVIDIQAAIDKLEVINVVPQYGDLSDDADKAIEETVKKLESMLFQQQSLNDQQAEIDKQKQLQAVQELEAQRLENEKAEEKRLAVQQEEADKRRIENEAELKARLPEDQKLREYGKALEAVEEPFVEDTYMLTIQSRAVTMVEDIVKFINDNTQSPADEDGDKVE